VLTNTLSRIHGEYDPLLENFAATFAPGGIDADLAACVAHRQQAPLHTRTRFPWLVALVVLPVLLLVGAWGIHGWLAERRWENTSPCCGPNPVSSLPNSGDRMENTVAGLPIRSRTIRNRGAPAGLAPGQVRFTGCRIGARCTHRAEAVRASLQAPRRRDGSAIVHPHRRRRVGVNRLACNAPTPPPRFCRPGAGFDPSAVTNTDANATGTGRLPGQFAPAAGHRRHRKTGSTTESS